MTIRSTALTALAAASQQFNQVAQKVSQAGVTQAADTDTVDLTQEMVRLLVTKTEFQTAVKLLHTADEMDQHTVDILV